MRAHRVMWCNECRRMVYPDILLGRKEEIDTKKDVATPFCPYCNCILPIGRLEEEDG